MKIVKKGVLPDPRYKRHGGMCLQIEDWSEDYSFHKPADLLAAYPLATQSRPAIWTSYYPEAHRCFRLEMRFDGKDDAEQAFDDILSGKTTLLDYTKYMRHPEYAECLK